MTVKEVANALGVSDEAVRKHARDLGYDLRCGCSIEFDEKDVAKISASFKDGKLPNRHNIVSVTDFDTVFNRSNNASVIKTRQNIPCTRLEVMTRLTKDLNSLTNDDLLKVTLNGMHTLLDRLTQENKSLKETLGVYNNFVTALRVEIINKDRFNAKKDWRKVYQYCKENNLEIKKIPDARYGHVNAYPLDAWYKVYPELDLPEEE